MDWLVDLGMPMAMKPWVAHIEDGYLIAPGHSRTDETMPPSIGSDYKVADLGSKPTFSWNKDERRQQVDGGMRPWREASEFSRINRVQSYLYTFHITDFDPGADTDAAAKRMVADGFIPHRVMACPSTGGVQTHHRLEIPISHKNANRMEMYRQINRRIAQRYGGDPMYVNQSAGYSPFSSLLWSLETSNDPYDMDRTSELVGLDGQLMFDLAMPISLPRHWGSKQQGMGYRNCYLFDAMRKIGYRHVRKFDDRGRFHDWMLREAQVRNLAFQSPLPLREVGGLVGSVVGFCWKNQQNFTMRYRNTASDNGRISGIVRAHNARVRAEQALGYLEAGIARTDVCARLGVTRRTLHRWERKYRE